jgi:hypothetical protein
MDQPIADETRQVDVLSQRAYRLFLMSKLICAVMQGQDAVALKVHALHGPPFRDQYQETVPRTRFSLPV